MKQFTYTIACPEGLHARPAGLLVQTAKTMDSTVMVEKGGRAVSADRLMALMTLGARQGDTVTVTLEGGGEEENLRRIEKFFQENL